MRFNMITNVTSLESLQENLPYVNGDKDSANEVNGYITNLVGYIYRTDGPCSPTFPAPVTEIDMSLEEKDGYYPLLVKNKIDTSLVGAISISKNYKKNLTQDTISDICYKILSENFSNMDLTLIRGSDRTYIYSVGKILGLCLFEKNNFLKNLIVLDIDINFVKDSETFLTNFMDKIVQEISNYNS